MTRVSSKAQSLNWGQSGPLFEVFLEPTCPFSAIAFGKLPALRRELGDDGFVLKIWLQSQPWHLFSGIICRAILAASSGPGGNAAAWTVMESIYARREDFEFHNHCSGPNLEVTPSALLDRIEAESGISVKELFARHDLDQDLKQHVKYARQNGIHASPTFMVNGLIYPDLGSRDPLEDWITAITRA